MARNLKFLRRIAIVLVAAMSALVAGARIPASASVTTYAVSGAQCGFVSFGTEYGEPPDYTWCATIDASTVGSGSGVATAHRTQWSRPYASSVVMDCVVVEQYRAGAVLFGSGNGLHVVARAKGLGISASGGHAPCGAWEPGSIEGGPFDAYPRASVFRFERVSGTAGQLPTAKPAVTCTGLTCTFDGTASADPDGVLTQYRWYVTYQDPGCACAQTEFSDVPTFQKTFGAATAVDVSLTVVDDDAGADRAVAQTSAQPPTGSTTGGTTGHGHSH
jgi:hypothetical protein